MNEEIDSMLNDLCVSYMSYWQYPIPESKKAYKNAYKKVREYVEAGYDRLS